MRDNVILRIGTKVLVPPILIYGFYVHFHGDYSPGGGFQGGVIVAAGFILYGLVYGLESLQRVLPAAWVRVLAALGVLIFSGTGVATMLLGGNYLDYDALGHDPHHAQELGIILVELGVLTTVFGVMVLIFYAFAGRMEVRG
ncbi:MAG: Na(+)/H(+) antiporter subunit B [Longimicrobiales bacterium]|nr:Na(+)/H(+) antiporter subunit B [Longimicrobiales bacterium]